MTAPAEKYPLWCVDLGTGDAPYLGPHDTEAEARDHHIEYLGNDDDVRVRRCRRVVASDGDQLVDDDCFDRIVEEANELASESHLPDVAWRDFEAATLVTSKPGAYEALLAWADEYLAVKAFVCEGDEPVEVKP